jgi:hypothetical protein
MEERLFAHGWQSAGVGEFWYSYRFAVMQADDAATGNMNTSGRLRMMSRIRTRIANWSSSSASA